MRSRLAGLRYWLRDVAMALTTMSAWVFALFAWSLVGAFLAGLWVGLAGRFFHIGLSWVTYYEQPVLRAWPLT